MCPPANISNVGDKRSIYDLLIRRGGVEGSPRSPAHKLFSMAQTGAERRSLGQRRKGRARHPLHRHRSRVGALISPFALRHYIYHLHACYARRKRGYVSAYARRSFQLRQQSQLTPPSSNCWEQLNSIKSLSELRELVRGSSAANHVATNLRSVCWKVSLTATPGAAQLAESF